MKKILFILLTFSFSFIYAQDYYNPDQAEINDLKMIIKTYEKENLSLKNDCKDLNDKFIKTIDSLTLQNIETVKMLTNLKFDLKVIYAVNKAKIKFLENQMNLSHEFSIRLIDIVMLGFIIVIFTLLPTSKKN